MIENLIAFVLLAGVILIVSSIYIKVTLKNVNLAKLDAIEKAHSFMERSVHNKDYVDSDELFDDKWIVSRKIDKHGNRIHISVRVFKQNKSKPIAVCHYIDIVR